MSECCAPATIDIAPTPRMRGKIKTLCCRTAEFRQIDSSIASRVCDKKLPIPRRQRRTGHGKLSGIGPRRSGADRLPALQLNTPVRRARVAGMCCTGKCRSAQSGRGAARARFPAPAAAIDAGCADSFARLAHVSCEQERPDGDTGGESGTSPWNRRWVASVAKISASRGTGRDAIRQILDRGASGR